MKQRIIKMIMSSLTKTVGVRLSLFLTVNTFALPFGQSSLEASINNWIEATQAKEKKA